MKKTKYDLDFDLKTLENLGKFNINYDGDDWGTFEYSKGEYISKDLPVSFSTEDMLRAIKDEEWFIQAKAIKEDK